MRILFTVTLLLYSSITLSQDPFFSQFYNTPLLVNPAFTGTAYGYVRASMNYKEYFNDFDDIQTVALAGDMSLLENDRNPDYAGIGMTLLHDQAGKALRNTRSHLSFAYHNAYGRLRNEFLAFGMQVGVDNTNLDLSGLSSQNQWVQGIGFDAGLSNGEMIPSENATVLDFSAGVMWYKFLRDGTSFIAGLSTYHLTEPNREFVSRENELSRRYIAHASSRFPIHARVNLAPTVLYFYQAGLHTISPGTSLEFVLQKSGYLSVGAWVRNLDALIGTVQFEYSNLTVGASYDLLLSNISETTRNGGAELSITYLIKRRYKTRARIRSNIRPKL
ncbi:MAG: PorP/SprF family type IX secretion system membrane protein [Cytophagales bacterium]|nr:PorP/SprF family type IX secretion system membrane protein [Cytophagales bacterium]